MVSGKVMGFRDGTDEDREARAAAMQAEHLAGTLKVPKQQSPEDEAARVARRKARKGRLLPGTRREAPGDARLAAIWRTEGKEIAQIAAGLECSYQRARLLLKRPDVQSLMTKFREQHRLQTLEKAADMTPRIFRRMGHAIDDTNPAAVGQVKDLVKSVLDLERVAASASGELKPATTTIQVQNLLAQQQGADPKQQLETLLTVLEDEHGFGSASPREEGTPLSDEDLHLRWRAPEE